MSCLVALLAALTGCVKYHPHSLDPPRSEQQFRARSLADAGLQRFVNRPNWPPQELSWNDLVAVAYYFNPDLDVARAQVRTARAAIVTAGARPNPSLSGGSGWTNSPESPRLFSLDPSLMLVTAGKRGLRVAEAAKLADAARAQVAETAWRVRSRVRAAWLDYVIAQRSLAALQGERKARAEQVEILDKRLAVGEVSRPDLDAARAALVAIEAEEKAAETSVAESGATLAASAGLPQLPPVDDYLPETPPTLTAAEVERAGLLHRADVRRSLIEYAAAEAGLRLEIANQYPDISLNPMSYGFDEGHHKLAFTPGSILPILNQNQGPIAQAEARRAEMEARFNGLQAQAVGEMQIALARYHGALAELADADRRLSRIEQPREDAVRRGVRAGEQDRLALAGAQVETAGARRARVTALFHVQSALGALEDAVQQPLAPGAPLPDPESKP
jgi:outer membrane protein, heavy metal efflux system